MWNYSIMKAMSAILKASVINNQPICMKWKKTNESENDININNGERNINVAKYDNEMRKAIKAYLILIWKKESNENNNDINLISEESNINISCEKHMWKYER